MIFLSIEILSLDSLFDSFEDGFNLLKLLKYLNYFLTIYRY